VYHAAIPTSELDAEQSSLQFVISSTFAKISSRDLRNHLPDQSSHNSWPIPLHKVIAPLRNHNLALPLLLNLVSPGLYSSHFICAYLFTKLFGAPDIFCVPSANVSELCPTTYTTGFHAIFGLSGYGSSIGRLLRSSPSLFGANGANTFANTARTFRSVSTSTWAGSDSAATKSAASGRARWS